MVRLMWMHLSPPDGVEGATTPVRCSRQELCRRENGELDTCAECRLNRLDEQDSEDRHE